MSKKYLGATLVEVIIVVTIISMLVVIFITVFRTQLFRGNDAKRKGDLFKIAVALEEYEKDKNCYPAQAMVGCNPGVGLKPYLDKVPCDPITQTSYFYEPGAGACPASYKIYSILENKLDEDFTPGIGPGGGYNYVVTSPNI